MNKKSQILKFLQLDKEYLDGYKDYLYYKDEKGSEHRVLDVVGSYGVNLLGHKHPSMMEYLDKSSLGAPFFVQLAENNENQLIREELHKRISEFTGSNEWEVEFANSGTEIIEATIKLCLLYYNRRRESFIYKLRSIFGCNEFSDQCRGVEPVFLHLKGSYHGKTLGSLSIMSNREYQQPFPFSFRTEELGDSIESFSDIIDSLAYTFTSERIHSGKKSTLTFYPIAGIFIEPIQGEAGVKKVNDSLLHRWSTFARRNKIPLVFDEIQSGLYRTGSLSAIDSDRVTADIYCFGKSLGGGIAKISCLCCKKSFYDPRWYKIHTSTFSEDVFSSGAAYQFFQVISQEEENIHHIRSNWLKESLERFADDNSEFVKEVRGEGYMLAIELEETYINTSLTTKSLKDLGILGYWISSVLLNRERIRILPTLSNELSFRIQPSLFFSENDCLKLLKGFNRFFEALKTDNQSYLLGHIFPKADSFSLNPLSQEMRHNKINKGAAFFICHPTDLNHLRNIISPFKSLSDQEMYEWIETLKNEQEFSVYHIDTLYNNKGNSIQVVFLGIPVISAQFYQSIREGDRDIWIQKVQRAIDFANSYEASSIGLGQFTSIITQNGTLLESGRAILTTGNAYTAALVIKSIETACGNAGIDPIHCEISLVGASGNIISVIAKILSNSFGKIQLVFRPGSLDSNKTQSFLIDFLHHVKCKNSNIGNLLRDYASIDSISLPAILKKLSDVIVVTDQLSSIATSSVVVLGTNSTDLQVGTEWISKGTVVVDVAVPPNANLELQKSFDCIYLKGGMASLPVYNQIDQILKSPILPMEGGECFACMAETFGLAFHGNWDKNQTGDITVESVFQINDLMQSNGFDLKRYRISDTIKR